MASIESWASFASTVAFTMALWLKGSCEDTEPVDTVPVDSVTQETNTKVEVAIASMKNKDFIIYSVVHVEKSQDQMVHVPCNSLG